MRGLGQAKPIGRSLRAFGEHALEELDGAPQVALGMPVSS